MEREGGGVQSSCARMLGRCEGAGIELRVGNRPLPPASTRRGASRAAATVGTMATAPCAKT